MRSVILIVGALAAGILLGAGAGRVAPQVAVHSVGYIEPIGSLWLSALQMTIIPLLVSLLVTGIAAASDAARAGRLATRSVITFVVLLWGSAIFAALAMPVLLEMFPAPAAAAAALRSAAGGGAISQAVPAFADFLRSLLPSNPIAAAANDAVLPVIVFTTVFAFALTRLPPESRAPLTGFFRALGEAMLVVIGWVLALAPVGVFALGYAVAVKTGLAALGGLAHYIASVSSVGLLVGLSAFAVARFAGGLRLGIFLRAVVPAQAVAISTQSSLASLPAMLRSAAVLGIPSCRADVTLPLAVALFRVTGPAMNLAVAIYVAHLFGIALAPTTLAKGVAVAATATLATVSLPGTISFITAVAPIAAAMGVPVAPLALLVAVETLPDIIRTVGNVTMDVAVTAAVSRAAQEEE